MIKTFFAIILILIISFSSCKVQEVELGDLRGFEIGELKKESVDLKFDIPIKNTNNFKFKIVGADLKVKLEGREVGTISDINKIKVPANSSDNYTFKVNVNFSEIIKNSPTFLPSLMFKRNLNLSVKGHIKARAFLFVSRKFDVEESKLISLFNK